MTRLYYVGIDLGGTNAKAGVVSDDGKLLAKKEKVLTNLEPEEVVVDLVSCATDALAEAGTDWSQVERIGVGSPGAIEDGKVISAANFPTWKDVPLAALISDKAKKVTTVLANDATAAAAGEQWMTGASNLVIISTGVGCGVIVDGKPVHGASDLIEAGHMIVQPRGEVCGCSQRGCLEAYASARSIAKRAARIATNEGIRSTLAGRKNLCSKDVFEAAEAGDVAARAVIEEAFDYLGIACVNICRLIDPERIVLAGGVSKAGQFLVDGVRSAFHTHTWTKLPNKVTITTSVLGENAGIVGAAAVARHSMEAART